MKHEIANHYKKPILLSEFDLSDHQFSNEWLNGFFINPITNNIILMDKDLKLIEKKLFINFSQIELPNNLKYNEFIKQINKEIKKHIIHDWNIMSKVYPIYNYYKIPSEDKDKNKYIFIYLSPNRSNQVFDFDQISNKDILIEHVLEILVKASFLENMNQNNPLSMDVCLGKIFLNSVVTNNEKAQKDFVNVFSYRLFFKNYKLTFKLTNEHFSLNSDKTKIQVYDDVCLINNYKYEKKEDARSYGRLFLDFRNFEKLKETKFITQLHLYKIIESMLNRFKIKYNTTVFEPQFIYNNFSSFDNEIKEINIYISEDEKKEYEKDLLEKGIKNGINSLISYIKQSFNIDSKLIINPSFQDLLLHKDKYNLFLMYGEKYKDNYVSRYIENEKKESWNDAMLPFLKEEMFMLDCQQFLLNINSFDIYSQVKLFNIYANMHELNPIVSQGLILKKSTIFEEPNKEEVEDKNEQDIEDYIELENDLQNKKIVSSQQNKKPYPRNGTKSMMSKIINELNIKYNLFIKQKFKFLIKTENNNNIVNFNNIKIIQKLPKDKYKLYAVLILEKDKESNEEKHFFNIKYKKIVLDKEINKLNIDIDIEQELKKYDNIIIIDDTYLIKIKDNDTMPFMIIEKSHLNDIEKDPMVLIEKHIMEGKSRSTSVSKKTGEKENLFFPYNTPVIKTLINKKIKEIKGYSNCMLDFNDNELNIFMTLSNAGIQATMAKNNRLENIELFKNKDFSYEKINWQNNEQILYFYLNTLTFNYLNINELSKKSLLNKLTETILVN